MHLCWPPNPFFIHIEVIRERAGRWQILVLKGTGFAVLNMIVGVIAVVVAQNNLATVDG